MAARYAVLLATKLEPDVARKLRKLAREDDRNVSAFLRRTLTALVRPAREPKQGADAPR